MDCPMGQSKSKLSSNSGLAFKYCPRPAIFLEKPGVPVIYSGGTRCGPRCGLTYGLTRGPVLVVFPTALTAIWS